MDVFTFDSDEEMRAHLQAARAEAKAGLHPEQERITHDDYWVEFLDVGSRIVIFGRVHTLEEIRWGEDPDDVDEIISRTVADLDDGMMFGEAFSRLEPAGELGYTHKANVWPIEKRLHDAAMAVNWEIDRLDPPGKALLQIAYSAWRAHRLASKS